MGIGIKRSESASNPQGAIANWQGVDSLFSGVNDSPYNGESAKDSLQPVLSLDLEDDKLIELSNGWSNSYRQYYGEIKKRADNNYKYWTGDQYESRTMDSRGQDNLVFESTETLLPLISRQNPEPLVIGETGEIGDFIAKCTSRILEKKADETRLKSKIKTATRQWAIYYLGCFKMGWDKDTNDMYYQIVHPERLILDRNGFFDGGEFKGKYIGEEKTETAEVLSTMFPEHADYIAARVKNELGTSLTYHEWWTNEFVFWRLDNVILSKSKNPYWNGSTKRPTMDDMGVAGEEEIPGVNHFASPKMPYSFLSVFSTGKQPHDETSLIEQTISLQDIVNKRLRQIDKNADETNNSWVFSSDFSQDQGKMALNALRNGGAIIATTQNIGESVQRLQAPQLASFVYQDLIDKREQIYNIMGVRGSMAQGILSERTVRGKIEIKGQDVDRLSLIVEQIEQFVDHLFNLAVQTIYVFYTPEDVARTLGAEDGARYLQLLKEGPSRRLTVSVKEGSMIPQDPLMRRNEAMDLWNAKALSLESLYNRLDFADPKDEAKKTLQEQLTPDMTLQELGGVPPQPPGMPGMPGEAQLPPMIPPNL
jgi:hypothetical protein